MHPDTIRSSQHTDTDRRTPTLGPSAEWTRTSVALTGPYWFISLFCVSCKAATVAVAVAVAVAAAAATAAAAAAAAGWSEVSGRPGVGGHPCLQGHSRDPRVTVGGRKEG